MEKEENRRLLLSLKKELKCWESMFERKHGKKPSKVDIEESPAEIYDAYRQYRQLKGQHSQGENPSIKTTKSEVSPTLTRKQEVLDTVKKTQHKGGGDNVFGSFLNKMDSKKKEPTKVDDKKSTWKLRRWTKERGYMTVTGGREEGESGDRAERGKSSSGKDCDQMKAVTDEEDQSSTLSELDVQLQKLSKDLKIHPISSPIKNSIGQFPSKTPSCTQPRPTKPLTTGECQNVLLAGRGSKKSTRLKHCSGISAKWLGRCKPDLEHLDATETHDGESVLQGQSSLDKEDVACKGQSSQDGEGTVSLCQGSPTVSSNYGTQLDSNLATNKFEYWRGDDVIANGCYDTESSDEDDPFLIKRTSAEQLDQKLNEFSSFGFSAIDDIDTRNTVPSIVPSTTQHEQVHSRFPLNIYSTKCQSDLSTGRDGEQTTVAKHEAMLATSTASNANGNDSGDQTMPSCSSRDFSLSSSSKSRSGLSMLEVCTAKSQNTSLSNLNRSLLSKSVTNSSKFAKSMVRTSDGKRTKQWRVHQGKQDTSQEVTMTSRSRGITNRVTPIKSNRRVMANDESASTNTRVGQSQFEKQSELNVHLQKKKTHDEKLLSKPAVKVTEKYSHPSDTQTCRVNTPSSQADVLQSDITEEAFQSEFEVLSEEEKDIPILSRGKDDSNTNGDEEVDSDDSQVSQKAKKPSSKSTSSTSRGSAVSDNFVRLNMKVKRFSRRPGRGLTGSAHKRLAWKKMQKGRSFGSGGGGSGLGKSGRSGCFKCGNPGHWAKNCTASAGSKNLGKFDGEKVGFSDKMAAGDEGDLDEATLEELSRESPFPTVEDAAMMARGIKFGSRRDCQEDVSEQKGLLKEEVKPSGGESEFQDGEGGSERTLHRFIAPPPCHTPTVPRNRSVDPLFPTVDGKITTTPESVHSALRKFGYDSFRPGQEEAVMRILSGVSTLLINSTGSGKSLCYQLPAYLYCQSTSCLALVISPLVSLMEDQVQHFPVGLRGGCVHTSQTRPQREKILKDAVEGRLNVLLLSPEALVGGVLWSKSGGGAYSLNQLPPVAFACIDEAHCVSEWSHNFRPSYLRIYKVLKERLGVYCVLALTATATYQTALSVATNLGISQESILRGPTLPDNLYVSVSCDQDRDQALVELLQNSTFRLCESIIIYCTRQQETERIAQLLRTCLHSIPNSEMGIEDNEREREFDPEPQGVKSKSRTRKRKNEGNSSSSGKGSKRQKVEWSAECYHAGMQAYRRRKVQSDFMSGRLRIVVATVAFGMGLNKSDVRAIIHYSLPKSFESFVQEIGRAGRDGLPAYCHVFIHEQGSDLSELRRHAYSNTVERYCVKQLMNKAFPSCQCKLKKQTTEEARPLDSMDSSNLSLPKLSSPRWCNGHEVAFPIESMVNNLDVKEECISTLLCYLELEGWLDVMNPVNDNCTLKCYNGARQLRALAQKVPAVAAATARLRENGTNLDGSSTITFSVTETADSMGWESYIVRSELNGLLFNDRGTGGASRARSTVLVEFGTLSFRLRSLGDLTPDERDYVCDFLYSKVKSQEERAVEKLHVLHAVLKSVASTRHQDCFEHENETAKKLQTLNDMIKQYFSKEGLDSNHLEGIGIPILKCQTVLPPKMERQVCDDIHSLISIHREQSFTGRAVARIFHGISSPLFEAIMWGGQKRFWRRHMDVDFNLLCQLAKQKILDMR